MPLIHFVDIEKPSWLEYIESIDRLYPSKELIISLASMRSRIYLASSRVLDDICRLERVCIDTQSIDIARKALEGFIVDTAKKLDIVKDMVIVIAERRAIAIVDLVRFLDSLEELIQRIEKFDISKASCGTIAKTVCYISRAGMSGLDLGVEPPAIVIALDRVEVLASDIENYLGIHLEDEEKDKLKLALLKSFIAYGVARSFMDTGNGVRDRVDLYTRRIIEESLATYYQLSYLRRAKPFRAPQTLYEVFKYVLLPREAAEYRASLSWMYLSPGEVDAALKLWSGLYIEPRGAAHILNMVSNLVKRIAKEKVSELVKRYDDLAMYLEEISHYIKEADTSRLKPWESPLSIYLELAYS